MADAVTGTREVKSVFLRAGADIKMVVGVHKAVLKRVMVDICEDFLHWEAVPWSGSSGKSSR